MQAIYPIYPKPRDALPDPSFYIGTLSIISDSLLTRMRYKCTRPDRKFWNQYSKNQLDYLAKKTQSFTLPQFIMKSLSTLDSPHVIHIKDLKISCDNSCQSFTGFNICSHTLAVSSKMENLTEYVCQESQRTQANLLAISNIGVAKRRGKKPKAINKRKYAPSTKQKISIAIKVVVNEMVMQPQQQLLLSPVVVNSSPTSTVRRKNKVATRPKK